MKTIKPFLYTILFLAAVSFTACSKDDDGGDGGGSGGDEYLTAKIDGSNYTGGSQYGDIIAASLNSNILGVQGTDDSGKGINFSITNYTGVGTYKTGDVINNMNLIQYIQINPMGAWISNGVIVPLGLESGEIKITKETDVYVEGTFRFVGYNSETETTKTITEGKFRANFE